MVARNVNETSTKPTRRLLLVVNPAAGRLRLARTNDAVEYLRQANFQVTVYETQCPGDAEKSVADCVQRLSTNMIVVAGGDGTLNEVVNGLPRYLDIPLAILPCGTANVLAREIGIRKSFSTALRTIVAGTPLTIHPGNINGRRFLLMAGIGFDAAAVAAVSDACKRWVGKGAYLLAGLKVILSAPLPSFSITLDGQCYTATTAIIGKARYYGGPFLVTPDARLTEPSFQVCIFARGGKLDLLRHSFGIATGLHGRLPDVTLRTVQCVQASAEREINVQIDGEPFSTLPVSCRIDQSTLTLLTPQA